jgi:hypothetical protein
LATPSITRSVEEALVDLLVRHETPVAHDAFAVIREAMRHTAMVAPGCRGRPELLGKPIGDGSPSGAWFAAAQAW